MPKQFRESLTSNFYRGMLIAPKKRFPMSFYEFLDWHLLSSDALDRIYFSTRFWILISFGRSLFWMKPFHEGEILVLFT